MCRPPMALAWSNVAQKIRVMRLSTLESPRSTEVTFVHGRLDTVGALIFAPTTSARSQFDVPPAPAGGSFFVVRPTPQEE